jgi:hypothetical protein
MGKTLIKWQLNPQLIPIDPKERLGLYMMFMDMIKKDMEAGNLTGWGVYSDGSGGYAFTKLGSKELYTMVLKWSPYVMFDAKSVLGVEETVESLKKAAETK